MRIMLGSEVKDVVTGIKGIAVSRIEYLNGCVRYEMQPRAKKDGKVPESRWVDKQQLQVLKPPVALPADKEVAKKYKNNTGGPGSIPTGFSRP